MDTIKDIALSIRDWLKERVGNPFFAAFIAAWCTVNWRVLLILFGDMTAHQKLTWVDQRLYPAIWHWPIFGFVLPLMLALIYVIATPPAFRWLAAYHRRQQHISKSAMLAADEIEPVSPEHAERLIRERIRARAELKKEKARFAELESEYLDQIEKLQQKGAESGMKVLELTSLTSEGDRVGGNDNESNEKVWKFNASDFIGINSSTLSSLVQHGLRNEDAKVLYDLKDMERFGTNYLHKIINKGSHETKVVISRLKGLNLLDDYGDSTYSLNNLGLQTIDQLKRKGFAG